MNKKTPLISVVTVSWNDAWAATKTCRSVFCQKFKDFEYIYVDGAAPDGTQGLIDFWLGAGLINKYKSERDSGVYDAMNKGISMAEGKYVCFLNAGDVFYSNETLGDVAQYFEQNPDADGILGWGELNGVVWASWAESEAIKLSSLGFCHQALYVKRSLLAKHKFKSDPFRTDSDTLQLGSLFAAKAKIDICPSILAIRGGEPGISADQDRTKKSILVTLNDEYGLDEEATNCILNFRRKCEGWPEFKKIFGAADNRLKKHLSSMALDTLFQRQSTSLSSTDLKEVFDVATAAFGPEERRRAVNSLLAAQDIRARENLARQSKKLELQAQISKFGQEEEARYKRDGLKAKSVGQYEVSLTSFPARISSVHWVIKSILTQSVRPQKVHLWLGADEIPSKSWLPRELLNLEVDGLEIHFSPKTRHQYDKFTYLGEINSRNPFVIVDDDVIYPYDSMENLLALSERHPSAIVANRCHQMLIAEGVIQPYESWPRELVFSEPSMEAFPTGAGGVLYPKGFLGNFSSSLDIEKILRVAPYADDVWLKFVALAQGVSTASTPLSAQSKWYVRYTPTMKAGALHETNVDLGLNDIQLARAIDWLKVNNLSIWEKLMGVKN